ncbi:thioesterase family protein [Nocardioides sp. JQ2195]|uniref:acyl-CoA thioesterase domain-containing protein n=1 Tax=Nocardioides sp. JQ2195 TaxID=2592334 RepID=UPI00143E5554|nr:acyl-CoA thioesterase domain-containing protein [Nocardioides sp. JQ2195]QIX28142.1 thioesterase family protein [Nocardioides sp. JQ2195]
MGLAFYRRDGDSLVPQPLAKSLWGANNMHGVAISAGLSRAAERALRDLGRDDLQPARYTVDLFRPAAMVPSTFTAEVVREGPRICLIDVSMLQEGERVARASALFLSTSTNPSGEVWQPADADRPAPPPLDLAPEGSEPHVPWFHSSAGWSQDFSEHQNSARKATWQTGVPAVDGEPATPFTAVASIADATTMVVNWGSKGVEHINTDITVTLSRLPDGVQLGLSALDHLEHDGISVGTATIFDRRGPIGTTVMTAIANTRRTVDFDNVTYADDGSRSSPGA